MSICISKHGEYSSHHEPTPDDPFTCVLCGQLDKEGLLTALAERDAEVERLTATLDRVRAVVSNPEWQTDGPGTAVLHHRHHHLLQALDMTERAGCCGQADR